MPPQNSKLTETMIILVIYGSVHLLPDSGIMFTIYYLSSPPGQVMGMYMT
jgi:hypothetical protein